MLAIWPGLTHEDRAQGTTAQRAAAAIRVRSGVMSVGTFPWATDTR